TLWQRQLREKQRVCWLVSRFMRIQDTGPLAARMSCTGYFMRFPTPSWTELTQEEERSLFLILPAPPLEAWSEWHICPMGSTMARMRSNEWPCNLQRWPFTILHLNSSRNGVRS